MLLLPVAILVHEGEFRQSQNKVMINISEPPE
jgi:hypothetical protein